MACSHANCKMKPGRGNTLCIHHRPDDCFLECSICLKPIKRTKETLDCNHSFHRRCIEFWTDRANTCPVCRAPAYEELNPEPENPMEFFADQFARAIRDIDAGATQVNIEFRFTTSTANGEQVRLVNMGPDDPPWLTALNNLDGALGRDAL